MVKFACFRELFLLERSWNLDCFCNICYHFTPYWIVLHLKKFIRSNLTLRQDKGKSLYKQSKAKRFDYGNPYSNAFTGGQVKFSSCSVWDKRYKRDKKLKRQVDQQTTIARWLKSTTSRFWCSWTTAPEDSSTVNIR